MAFYKFSRQQKYCGTCNYWMGCRKLDSIYTPHFVIIEGQGAEEMGQCSHRRSGWWNMQRKANQMCAVWDLFARLKNL